MRASGSFSANPWSLDVSSSSSEWDRTSAADLQSSAPSLTPPSWRPGPDYPGSWILLLRKHLEGAQPHHGSLADEALALLPSSASLDSPLSTFPLPWDLYNPMALCSTLCEVHSSLTQGKKKRNRMGTPSPGKSVGRETLLDTAKKVPIWARSWTVYLSQCPCSKPYLVLGVDLLICAMEQ